MYVRKIWNVRIMFGFGIECDEKMDRDMDMHEQVVLFLVDSAGHRWQRECYEVVRQAESVFKFSSFFLRCRK
jgi:hypothetical protein